MLFAEAIDGGLDRRIQQLDNEDENAADDQHEAFEAGAPQPKCEWHQHDGEGDLLAKCRLVLPRVCKTLS